MNEINHPDVGIAAMDSARYRRLRRSRQCQYRQPYQSSWPAQACWVPMIGQNQEYIIIIMYLAKPKFGQLVVKT